MLQATIELGFRRLRGTLPALHRLFAACALVALAALVSISVAAAYAYPNIGAAPWQFSKASRTSEAGIEGAGEITTVDEPTRLHDPYSESVFYSDHVVPLQKLPRPLRVYHFRPPPLCKA